MEVVLNYYLKIVSCPSNNLQHEGECQGQELNWKVTERLLQSYCKVTKKLLQSYCKVTDK